MGSILSKLFGGGNHQQGSNAPAATPPSNATQPSGTAAASTSSVTRSTNNAFKPQAPPPIAPPPSAPIKPAPVNILEVHLDEEAFKETSPLIYTSTIKAQIDPSPPHPLEQYPQKAQVHLTTVEAPKSQLVQTQAPIATIDSDYEDEIAQLENQEIEDAVIKIQAGVRGFLVRKQIHANKSQPLPVKSKSLDDPTSMANQQQDNILPPPQSFVTSSGSLAKPSLVSNKSKRVETPIPGSPFAQDDTGYSILDSVDPQEPDDDSKIIANPEELEIFKKINEINQLLASKDEEEIEIVPEPPKSLPQSPMAATSSASINSLNNALNELDNTIREHEFSLPPEADDEVLVIESAFIDPVGIDTILPATPQSPSVLVQAPSLEEEPVPDASSNLTEEAAAIRIQAAFRGYEVRKSLSREVSPSRNGEDEHKSGDDKIEESEAKPQEPDVPFETPQTVPEPEQTQSEAELEPVVEQEPESNGLIPQSEVETNVELVDESKQDASQEFEQKQHEEQNQPNPVQVPAEPKPEPVKEELLQVAELSDQIIIKDPEPESQPQVPIDQETIQTSEVPLPETLTAQTFSEPVQSQEPEVQQEPFINASIKDGDEVVVSQVSQIAPVEERKALDPVVDIEKSIQELEKSFDRDLLADITAEVAMPESAGQPAGEEGASLINIEPPTPNVSQHAGAQAPLFVSSEPLFPSKIPVLDRTSQKSILKEPSSPEPNAYSNLPLPSCASPLSDTTSTTHDGDEDTDDEAEPTTPSPIPVRASSPSPFSKKRHRRSRGNKKK